MNKRLIVLMLFTAIGHFSLAKPLPAEMNFIITSYQSTIPTFTGATHYYFQTPLKSQFIISCINIPKDYTQVFQPTLRIRTPSDGVLGLIEMESIEQCNAMTNKIKLDLETGAHVKVQLNNLDSDFYKTINIAK